MAIAAKAFVRYQEIFGGELVLLPMSDVPAEDGAQMPPEQADLIMHAALKFDDQLLMASDDGRGDFGPVQGMYVNYAITDVGEAERVFAALAEGGEVEMPIEEVFWAPRFGVCKDRFGTPWMVSADHPTND